MIWSLILGGLAGWIASLIMKKDAEMGVGANIIVGIVGGALGSWIFGLLGLEANGNMGQIVVGIVGAVILLAIINAIKGKKN